MNELNTLGKYQIIPSAIERDWLVAFTTIGPQLGNRNDFSVPMSEQRRHLELALEPVKVVWLELEHGDKIVKIKNKYETGTPVLGDAAIISEQNTAVAFTTADCLPIVCVSRSVKVAAAIHAGWRGIATGVVESTIESLSAEYRISPKDLEVWLGPAIQRDDYEIRDEVRDALLARPVLQRESRQAGELFTVTKSGHCLVDLGGVVTTILTTYGVGVDSIKRYTHSTRQSPFLHSVRRDGKAAGRMATVVGIKHL